MSTLTLLTLALAAFTTAYPARTPEPASATPPSLPCRVAGGEMKCLPGTADTAFPVEQLKATIPKIDSEMVQRERSEKYMPPQHPSRAPMEAIPTPPMGRIYWPREIRGSDDHVAPIWVREAATPTPTPDVRDTETAYPNFFGSPVAEAVAPKLPK